MAKFLKLPQISRFKGNLPAFMESEGFIKATVDNLANYYKKSESYTQLQVNDLLAAGIRGVFVPVTSLPDASADTMGKIYLVPATDPKQKNLKEEYITIDNGEGAESRYTWESIGSTAIDLSNYYTKTQTDEAIASAVSAATKDLPVDVQVDGDSIVDENGVASIETATDEDIDALFE